MCSRIAVGPRIVDPLKQTLESQTIINTYKECWLVVVRQEEKGWK